MSYRLSIKNTFTHPLKAVIARNTHNIKPLDTTEIHVPSNVNLIEIYNSDIDGSNVMWKNFVPAGVTLDIVNLHSHVYGIISGDTKLRSLGSSWTSAISSSMNGSTTSMWWWIAFAIVILVLIILAIVFLMRRRNGSQRGVILKPRHPVGRQRRAVRY